MQMKKVNFGSTGKQVPAIVMGCMRMKELTVKEAAKLVDAAMAEGVDFFDHADIYGGGVCEERFKEAAEEAKISREDMWIQSKCGIVPGVMYDFSKEHIIKFSRRFSAKTRNRLSGVSSSSQTGCAHGTRRGSGGF